MSSHVPSAFKRWWLILWEQFGGGSGGGSEGGGLSVEAIDALPVAANFHNGDRLIVSKGVEPATLTGTCSGVSSNPNATIIGDATASVDSGLGPVAFAAAIVAALNNPLSLEQMKASSIDDNGDGTFEVSHYPGVFANSIVSSGSDGNPSFEVTYPGSSELDQVDKSTVIAEVLDAVSEVDIFDGLPAQSPPLTTSSLLIVNVSNDGLVVTNAGISAAQGSYSPAGTANSKPNYSNGTYYIQWNTSGFSGWVFQTIFGSVKEYVSYDDVATPDLVTTWVSLNPVTVSGLVAPLNGINGVFTPTGVLVNGKLKYFRGGNFLYYTPSNKWRLHEEDWNGEDAFESTSTGNNTPELATGWAYIGSDGGAPPTPVIIPGTSVPPVPVISLPTPETKTIEWGQLIDPDPTFLANSDLIVPTQKAVNRAITERAAQPLYVELVGTSTDNRIIEPLAFPTPITTEQSTWYMVDILAIPQSGLDDPESYVGIAVGTESLVLSTSRRGPAINWNTNAETGVLSYGNVLFGPFGVDAGISGRFFIEGNLLDLEVAITANLAGTDTVYPEMIVKVVVTRTVSL